MRIGKYETHPSADLFPLMSAEERSELAADILENGLRLPVTLCDGKVLDGRNRLMACEQVKCPARFEEFTGTSPTTWVLSMNLMRRHLTADQKTGIGIGALPLLAQEASARQRAGTLAPAGAKGKAAAQAAKIVGVSTRSIERGKAIQDAAPELIPAMVAGTVRLAEAQELSRLPKAKRALALEKIAAAPEKSRARTAIKEIQQEEKREMAEGIRAEPPPAPKGPFRVIAIDPPWRYESRTEDVSHRGRTQYPDMSTPEICALPVATLAAKDCVLWLWTTNSFMGEAYTCLDAWGFTPKTILTWDKQKLGLGDWLRNVTEHCILAVRGKPVVTLTNQTTLISESRREHSRKPEAFYSLVEALCPGGKLEMFARAPRDGWAVWGAETGKFAGAR